MQGLMASVANVKKGPHYDADIIMNRENTSLIFTFGSTAYKVDRIDFTLLGDPTRFHSISSTDANIQIIGQADMGVYHVSVDMHGRDINPGTRVADLISVVDMGSALAITDTQFVSGGQRYSLSSK